MNYNTKCKRLFGNEKIKWLVPNSLFGSYDFVKKPINQVGSINSVFLWLILKIQFDLVVDVLWQSVSNPRVSTS